MARRHLHELLSEEQEPFALKSFIDERRCQLRRPSSKYSSTTQHHHQRLQIKRHTSPVLDAHALAFSPLAKSPSSSFLPFREPFDCKRSPLLHLPQEKSPSPASRLTAALLLEAAMRIQKQEQQQQRSHKRTRRRRKKKEAESASKPFGLSFFASILKRMVVKKRQRGITGEEQEVPSASHAKDLLKWEGLCGETAGERTVQTARYKGREADLDVFNPHYASHTDRVQRNEEEGSHGQPASVCCRCGIPESSQNNGGAGAPSASDGCSVPARAVSNTSPSRQRRGPSSPGGPSPELQTPAASPDRRRTERQLLGGTGEDGRAEPPYYEEKKEQSSPVSVLDPPFDEDHHHDDHAQHPRPEAQEDEREGDGVPVDSFQRSLAIVQRAKKELLGRIRRFERLAELDPVELDRRLAEGDVEEDKDGSPHASDVVVDMEVPEVCELVRLVLGRSSVASKVPADMRRLVLDLAEEEKNGGGPEAADGVRRRFKAWSGVQSNTIDMIVEMDVKNEY